MQSCTFLDFKEARASLFTKTGFIFFRLCVFCRLFNVYTLWSVITTVSIDLNVTDDRI